MRPKGSTKELEVRRRIGGKLLQAGKGVRDEAAIKAWRKDDWPRIKKRLAPGNGASF